MTDETSAQAATKTEEPFMMVDGCFEFENTKLGCTLVELEETAEVKVQ